MCEMKHVCGSWRMDKQLKGAFICGGVIIEAVGTFSLIRNPSFTFVLEMGALFHIKFCLFSFSCFLTSIPISKISM